MAAVTFVSTLASGVAWAYWSAGSSPGGNGASAATTVSQGATPTASSAGNAVTVSWAARTLSNGTAVAGYMVKRYDVATVTLQTVLPACTGTVTALTCTENSVPTGQWVYSVTPVFATSWRGPESLKSNAVWVDSTPPVNAISLSLISGNAVKSGNTIYYRGSVAGSFTLTNAVSDSGSGPASSTAATLTGTTSGWNHSQSTVSTPAGGPYMSTSFTWTANTTSSPTEVVTGRDAADNTAATTLSFINDSTGPTGGSVAATGLVGTGGLYSISATLSLDLAKGTDLSGVAATGAQLLRATATLTSDGIADGSCGTYGTYALVTGGNDPATPKSDTVTDQSCYRYQYVAVDMLGNSTAYPSGDIKVDLTPPTAPSLTFGTFANTYWSSGSTVFYRSAAASGSLTATASAADTRSGIPSYTFPALGTNWTSTPGLLGVNTYTWTTGPAAPGTKSVTATNNATGTSAATSFTLAADDTAPTVGTVTYANTTTTNKSVIVGFTTGTDAGSGLATRLLQRADATLTNGTCGPFGTFATVSSNPGGSSYTDTVPSRGFCYKYQYVVSDNVGNLRTATSVSVVKVPTYIDIITGTAGLVSFWRLGDSQTASDSFAGSSGDTLQSHTAEIGSPWTKHAASTTNAVITNNRIRKDGISTLGALYYSSGVPTSADYTVEADVYRSSNSEPNDVIGIVGRLNTANTLGTYYAAVYERAAGRWALYSMNNGAKSPLGFHSQSFRGGDTYRLALDMTGSTIRLLVDGVEQVSVVNTTVTAAGRAGVTLGFGASNTTIDNSNGMHLDNFEVGADAADSWGTNTGDYVNGPTLGVAGAITGDANTAVQFDGNNDYVSVVRQISDDFSIEFWFSSNNGGGGSSSQWYSNHGLVDADVSGTSNDFGVSLRSNGVVVAGIGNPDTSISSSSGGFDDGAWHHVVFTRARTSGALRLYVDGGLMGSTTAANRAPLTSPANINFGRIQTSNNYFAGAMDEVAVYSTVLSAATVTNHYNANQ